MDETTATSENRSILVVGVKRNLVGLDVDTGAVVWSRELGAAGEGEVVEIAIHDGLVLAAVNKPVLYCLDYTTGKTLWTAQTSISGRASILADGERIFIGRKGTVDCFDFQGKLRWTRPLEKGTWRLALGLPGNVREADEKD